MFRVLGVCVCGCIACVGFFSGSPGIVLGVCLLLRFWGEPLGLGGCVLWVGWRLSGSRGFDLGLGGEDIDFWKFLVSQNSSKMQILESQGLLSSLLGPKLGFWGLGGFWLAPGVWLPGFGGFPQSLWGDGFLDSFWGVAVGVRTHGVFVCVFDCYSFGWRHCFCGLWLVLSSVGAVGGGGLPRPPLAPLMSWEMIDQPNYSYSTHSFFIFLPHSRL